MKRTDLKNLSFDKLNLVPALSRALGELNFSEMTPVQTKCIPLILAGKDLIGQSKTGSGKTAAFILPLLQKIQLAQVRPQALILCPTRELCDQVLQESRKFSKHLPNFKSLALIGGHSGTQPRTFQKWHGGNIKIAHASFR
jgi:ATP-independent RNA helicase DbpA